MSNYITVKEISKRLNVNPETVRRWIREGKLESTQDSRKKGNFIKESDFLAFCDTHRKYYKPSKEPIVMDDEILRAIEFHKSEIKRLERMLKQKDWG